LHFCPPQKNVDFSTLKKTWFFDPKIGPFLRAKNGSFFHQKTMCPKMVIFDLFLGVLTKIWGDRLLRARNGSKILSKPPPIGVALLLFEDGFPRFFLRKPVFAKNDVFWG
jgi:hypothetical protein